MGTAVVRAAPAKGNGWTTLQLLRASRAAMLTLDVLLVLAVVSATEAHRAAVKTVGKDAAPSIIAAQHIKSAMADMDADAANELLSPPGTRSSSADAYELRREEASRALITAAENITYGEAERVPIQSLQIGLGTYERLVQKSRDLDETAPPKAVAAYRDAAALMDTTLLPAADALDGANTDVLEQTYRSESLRSTETRLTIVCTGAALLFVLVWVQMMLSQRMHRTFNPPLLVATLLAGVTAFHAVQALAASHHQLKVAKEDAFSSIHALWRARATAYQANSEESRYLLDTAHAADHQDAFGREASALATLPPGLSPVEVVSALREGRRVDGFSGYLADELNNITFPGERDAAIDVLSAWQGYVGIDGQIRRLQRTNQARQALELCTGTAPGQSDWAFAQFDSALDRAL